MRNLIKKIELENMGPFFEKLKENGIVFKKSYADTIKSLTDDQAKILIRLIIEQHLDKLKMKVIRYIEKVTDLESVISYIDRANPGENLPVSYAIKKRVMWLSDLLTLATTLNVDFFYNVIISKYPNNPKRIFRRGYDKYHMRTEAFKVMNTMIYKLNHKECPEEAPKITDEDMIVLWGKEDPNVLYDQTFEIVRLREILRRKPAGKSMNIDSDDICYEDQSCHCSCCGDCDCIDDED